MLHKFKRKIKNIFKYRHFIATIIKKEFKVRYAQSYLGLTWLVLEPLLLVMTLSYIFSVIGRTSRGGHPFSLFFYSGLLPWQYFTKCFTTGTSAFINDADLIKKIYYPREISIVKNIAVSFIDYLFANVAFIILLMIHKYPPNWNYFYIPILLILETLFAYSITLLTASISVFIKDIIIIVNTLTNVWFFLTPILFHYPFSGRTKILYYVNPMSGIISNFRITILENKAPVIEQLYSILGYTLVFMITGLLVFKKLEKEFVDVL